LKKKESVLVAFDFGFDFGFAGLAWLGLAWLLTIQTYTCHSLKVPRNIDRMDPMPTHGHHIGLNTTKRWRLAHNGGGWCLLASSFFEWFVRSFEWSAGCLEYWA
jgi:hypothetical protein